jgi:hypothetical protein
VELSVDQLNPGRETTALERRVVQKALDIVARRAAGEKRQPPSLNYVDVRMPISLARLEQGYTSEDQAAKLLAERLWVRLFPGEEPSRHHAQQFCGLCFTSIPFGSGCPVCHGDRAKAQLVREAKLAAEQARATGNVPTLQFSPGSHYRLRFGEHTYQGQVVQDTPKHLTLWANGVIVIPKEGIVPSSITIVWRPQLATGSWIRVATIPPIQGVAGMPAHQVLQGEVTAFSSSSVTVGGVQAPVAFVDWYTFQPIEAPRVPPAPRPQQPLIDEQLATRGADAGFYYHGSVFTQWMDTQARPVPDEGWKMHITASAEHAGEVAALCLPYLRRIRITHKIVGNIDGLWTSKMTGTQVGKLITIYPESPEVAKQILADLDPLLHQAAVAGPAVPGEMPLGRSQMIYARYGGFSKETVRDPQGREVPDVRGQICPPWIQNPFV